MSLQFISSVATSTASREAALQLIVSESSAQVPSPRVGKNRSCN